MSAFCHKDVLRNNHIHLVNELDPDLFLHMLEPNLGKPITDSIKEQPSLKDKTRKLLDILSKAPAEKFEHFCKVIAGLYPSSYKLLQGCEPKKEDSDFFLSSFRDELCQSILSTGNKPDNEVDQQIDLDTQFVNLSISDFPNFWCPLDDHTLPAEYHQNFEHVESKNIDIDDILPKHSPGTSTLITGRAGVGKSTLIQYLIRQWAKRKWESTKTCVFLLNLRKLVNVQRDVSFTELLGLYAEYVVGSPGQKQLSLEWLKNNAQNVVFFTDGIDELPDLGPLLNRTPILSLNRDTRATPLDWCINLMEKNILQESTKVLVSRPFDDLARLSCDRFVDVLGLTPENVMLFIEKNVMSEKQDIVKETLLRDPVLLSVCSITFYCASLCRVLEVDSDIEVSDLKTYSRITAFVIIRLAARNVSEESLSSLMSDSLARCLPSLAALAYQGLLHTNESGLKRLIFTEDDIIEAGVSRKTMKEARRIGLLSYSKSKDPFVPNLRPTLLAQFIHLSVQEFLAAIEMVAPSSHNTSNKVKLFQAGRIDMTDIFAFGIVFDSDNIHIKTLRHTDKSRKSVRRHAKRIVRILTEAFEHVCSQAASSELDLFQAMLIAYESQRKDLARKLGETVVTDGEFTLGSRSMTAVDMMALLFMLRESKVKSLALEYFLIDTASAKEIQHFLVSTTCLKHLRLDSNEINEEAMRHLSKGIGLCKVLEYLQLHQISISDAGIGHLSEAIRCSTSLRHLDLQINHSSDESMRILSDGIKGSSTLEKLQLGYFQISNQSVQYICDAIRAPTSLKYFDFHPINLTNESVHYVCSAVGSPESNLSHLRLDGDRAEGLDMTPFFTSIQSTKSLKFLDLGYTRLNDAEMKALSDSINMGTSLEGLALSAADLTDVGMANLSHALKNSGSLQHLDVQCYCFKDKRGKYLFDALKGPTNLAHLILQTAGIHDKSMKYLSEAIRCNTSLNRLELAHNGLSDEGIRLLAHAIGCSSNLNHVRVLSTYVSETGIRYLSEALRESPGLQCLELSYQTVVPASLEYLRDASRTARHVNVLQQSQRAVTEFEVKRFKNYLEYSGISIDLTEEEKQFGNLLSKLVKVDIDIMTIS